MDLPLVEAESARRGPGRRALAEAAPDVLVVVAYGELLTREVLGAGRLGAVNVHFSLLPALRGASPVQHALLAGLRTTGVTTMLMDEGLDTGPVLLQASEPIRDDDDAGSLGARLADAGAALLVESLDRLSAGTRVKNSWYAPSRSRALARGVIAGTGRSDSRSIAQSSESVRRSVPYVSSVARSRSAW